MNICIVGSFPYHLECIGFLLEIFSNIGVNIYIHVASDSFNYLKHYNEIYDFYISKNLSPEILNKYDKIIKLSSNDPVLDNNNILSIVHLFSLKDKSKNKKYLSLTPYINGENIYNTFPVYRPNIVFNKNKTVIFIGYYKSENIDNDMVNFININKSYKFRFIIRGSPNYNRLKGLNNVELLTNIQANTLANLINESKYILSKKIINYDRFSGQLGLSISFEKPLLIDIKTKKDYNLPGISFNNDYSELGDLDNICDNTYKRLINEIKNKKEEIITSNKAIFSNHIINISQISQIM
jgi:hypothetical protein